MTPAQREAEIRAGHRGLHDEEDPGREHDGPPCDTCEVLETLDAARAELAAHISDRRAIARALGAERLDVGQIVDLVARLDTAATEARAERDKARAELTAVRAERDAAVGAHAWRCGDTTHDPYLCGVETGRAEAIAEFDAAQARMVDASLAAANEVGIPCVTFPPSATLEEMRAIIVAGAIAEIDRIRAAGRAEGLRDLDRARMAVAAWAVEWVRRAEGNGVAGDLARDLGNALRDDEIGRALGGTAWEPTP